jgi:UDP:flavonoid glycosyltransferase YjiC (YdhE family)
MLSTSCVGQPARSEHEPTLYRVATALERQLSPVARPARAHHLPRVLVLAPTATQDRPGAPNQLRLVQVSRILFVATAGAGGDLQPLVGAALGLRERGHDAVFLGDRSVDRVLRDVGVATEMLPPALDLGPRLAGAVREAMAATSGDLAAAGPIVQQRMAAWAQETAEPVAAAVRRHRPAAIVTSLFGVELLAIVAPTCKWAVVNSTFYIGPDPPRPVEQDLGPRALPLLTRYAALLEAPDLVLHATDRIFDFSFDRLPPRHQYVGPLGIWEQPSELPGYIAEPGDPWVLVSISSQLQDDIPLARTALAALADRPVRVVLTVGPDHDPEEMGAVPANARVERTISHAAVLGQGAMLVSHAGHGSVMKALWYGRPMVLVPWGRDQPGVAARAAALGIAEVVSREDASTQTLTAAADRALASETMRAAAAQHAARLQATDPQAVTGALLETLL